MKENYRDNLSAENDLAEWIVASHWEGNMKSKAPDSVNADRMTDNELREKVQKGYDDIAAGRVQDAEAAFAKFKEKHGWN